MYDLAFVIGRMQGAHEQHGRLIKYAQTLAQNVVVLLGSAGESLSVKNPFSYLERSEVIKKEFQVSTYPLYDYRYNDEVWVEQLLHTINDYKLDYSSDAKICIVGCSKDESSYYLGILPEDIKVETLGVIEENISSTAIRDFWYDCSKYHDPYKQFLLEIDTFKPLAATKELLWSKMIDSCYNEFVNERNATEDYKLQWNTPFPSVFVAVDAIIENGDDMLLITRKSEFGNGKLAMVGGYLEPGKTLLESVFLEIEQEAGLKDRSKFTLKDVKVFDDPNRSARGRMITHCHRFHYDGDLKEAVAGDDAATVEIVRKANVAGRHSSYRKRFFSDHWHILFNILKDEYDG